ncbi:hypothetical protein T484DRAFT_1824519, partial [Baffinella frigidus]
MPQPARSNRAAAGARGQQLLAVPPPVEDFAAQEEPPSSRHLLTNSPQSDGSSFVAAAPATRDAPYPVPTREERLSRQSSPVPQDPTSPLARTGGVGLSAEDLMEPSPPWAAPTPQPRSMQQFPESAAPAVDVSTAFSSVSSIMMRLKVWQQNPHEARLEEQECQEQEQALAPAPATEKGGKDISPQEEEVEGEEQARRHPRACSHGTAPRWGVG